MNSDDPYIVIANLMTFRLTRVAEPTSSEMASAARIAGEMLYHAQHEGIKRWLELTRKERKVVKDANQPPPPEKKLSSSSAASFSAGDTQ